MFNIRSCLNCGSWSVNKNYFCTDCFQQIRIKLSAIKPIEYTTFKINSLFYWRPGESDAFSQFILEMKESPIDVWQEYARLFLQIPRKSERSCVLVSSESLSGRKHAQFWGESLAQLTGHQHVVGLRLKNPKAQQLQQKELAKWARSHREFEIIIDISKIKGPTIFVDDVVTTGATAQAAYKALGSPRNFQVWSLACRELRSIATHKASW